MVQNDIFAFTLFLPLDHRLSSADFFAAKIRKDLFLFLLLLKSKSFAKKNAMEGLSWKNNLLHSFILDYLLIRYFCKVNPGKNNLKIN